MSIWIKTSLGWRPISSIASNHNDCQGVFRPVSDIQARAETEARAKDYARDVEKYLNGEISKEQIFRSFSIPIYGAFGEKL